ncbi:hypothetical protein IR114_08980 [Granulicatella sp. 19428wC4_WM01]|nr:hypothetical protein [Granulicatella sp. 19428wC4_WM01]
MFIEFISDYFLSGLNDNEIGMSIIEQGEKVKYSASIDCVISLPELSEYQFKFCVNLERFIYEDALMCFYDFGYILDKAEKRINDIMKQWEDYLNHCKNNKRKPPLCT